MSAAKKKQLFGEDSDSAGDDDAKAFAAEAEEGFKVNRAYASHYDQVKRKQELQRLSSKYGNVDDDDEDTDEDDDARLLTREAEADFAVLLKRLRSNDPTLRDKSVAFFRKQRSGDGSDSSSDDDDRPAKPSGKKFTLKDEFQRGVVATAEGEGGDDDDDGARGRRSRKAMTKEEKAARAAFLAAADQADTSAADFEVKEGTKGLARAAEKKSAGDADDADASAAIAEALGKSGDADDAFLANFFGKAAWKNEPGAAEPEYTWEQEAADEQDEQFYDDAEQWEKEFQEKRFRHEEGDAAAQIQAFPRQQEGLLRQKDTSRKEARERKAERKAQEESKAVEELKRLKNLKKEEIRAFQRKIAEVAGLGRGGKKKPAKKGAKAADDEPVHPDDEDDDDAAEEARIAKLLSQAALEEEYDPEKFDAQMAALFDDTYYQDVDDDELGVMAAEDDFVAGADDNEESNFFLANEADADAEGGDDDEEAGAGKPASKAARLAAAKKAQKKRQSINAELPEELRGVDDELLYPTKELEHALQPGSSSGAHRGDDAADDDGSADPAELKRQMDKKIEEYWALHHSSASGGLKTRFKYREVNPEKFGLELEEIFTMDDRALNMIAPLAAYATYNTRSQNTKDRYRALHRRKVLRLLPAERRSRRYKGGTVVFDPETIDEEAGKKIARTVRRRVEGEDKELDKEIDEAAAEEAAKRQAVGAAKQSKAQQRHGKGRGGGGAAPAGADGEAAQPQQRHGQQRPQHGGDKRPRSANPGQRGPNAQRGPRPERPQHQKQQQQQRPPRTQELDQL